VAAKHDNECQHGYIATEEHFVISDFVLTYIRGKAVGAGANVAECLNAAEKATKEKYPEVWYDPSKMKQVVSFFIFLGTKGVLDGKFDTPREHALLACYLEEYIAVYLHKTKALGVLTKVAELWSADEHTLVKYLKKNIPCNCLDEKYKEVKSITKMGLCLNPNCSIPDRRVERSKMLYCTRCRHVNYCSAECQKADWPEHKEFCVEHGRARAGLVSRE
jgi:hypothetical protein